MDRGSERAARATSEGLELSLRTVMSCFPTGVTVVATRDTDGQPLGLTVNSFTSVSLDPPLVLVCINRHANSHDPLLGAGGFTVSVLSGAQADIAARFAKWPSERRFEGIEWRPAPSGNPVLAGCAAWLDCSIYEVVTGGDHTIVLGRAEAADWSDEPALLFHRGLLGPVG
ncbi:MAG TPA: flavin reductase family protein [Longimicrobiales bacterium]|nr:flavin reductase family protein [Longimicrobiales bacterium]